MTHMNKMRNKYKKTNGGSLTISMFFLAIYVITTYVAQKGLLPTSINSMALYAFVGISFLNFCLNFTKIKIPVFTLWYAILIVLCVFSFLYAEHMVTGSLYVMFVALVLSFCYIVTVDNFEKLDILVRLYIFSALLMAFMLLVTDQLFVDVDEGERLGSNLSLNPNTFGSMFMLAAIFCGWYMVYRCKQKTRWLYILIYCALLFVMALSGGRKYLFAVLACTVVFILLFTNGKQRLLFRNILICISVGLAAIWAVMNIPILYESIGNRIEALFKEFFGLESDVTLVSSDKTRVEIIERALQGWKESPIFGNGFDNFKYYNWKNGGHFYYAHNNFAEMLYDLGAVGFIAYYGMEIYLLIKLIKLSKEFLSYKILGIGLLVATLIFDVGGVSYFTTFIICILSVVYIIVRLAYAKEESVNIKTVAKARWMK